MESRLAIDPTQTNLCQMKISSSITMENGHAIISSQVKTSWIDRNFSFSTESPIATIPSTINNRLWLALNGLLQTESRLIPYPCLNNPCQFNPSSSFQIRSPMPVVSVAPNRTQGYSPFYSTQLQNHPISKPGPSAHRPCFKGLEETPPKSNKTFTCNLCFKTFPSPQSLAGHRASHSKSVDKEARMNKRKKASVSSSPYKVKNGQVEKSSCKVTLVNSPFGPIVTPGFGDGSCSTPHVSSVTNYLLGVTDEKMKEKQVKHDKEQDMAVKKPSPLNDGLVFKRSYPRKGCVGPRDPPKAMPNQSGYFSDESVNSKSQPVEREDYDLSLRL